MAAITTILNPLLPADEELLTFWNSDSGDLVLVQRQKLQKPEDLIWTGATKQTGIVKNPSSIVALQYQGVINVYGITSGQTVVLKLLSPIVMPLKHNIPITQRASLAGAVNSDHTQGWLYYLTTNDADETVIAEYPIDGSSDPVILDPEPSQDTYLAATCWGENKRCLFFQKGLIKMVDIDAGSEVILKETKSAIRATPMAACTAPDAKGSECRYLYFADKGMSLQRLTITASGDTELDAVSKAPQLVSWAQLAVTPGKTHNFVSYVVSAGSKQKVAIYADERS